MKVLKAAPPLAGWGLWLLPGLAEGRDDEALLWKGWESEKPEDLILERLWREGEAYGFLCFALLA